MELICVFLKNGVFHVMLGYQTNAKIGNKESFVECTGKSYTDLHIASALSKFNVLGQVQDGEVDMSTRKTTRIVVGIEER